MRKATYSLITLLMFVGILGRIVAGSQVIPEHTPFSRILLKYAPSDAHPSIEKEPATPLEKHLPGQDIPRPWYALPDLNWAQPPSQRFANHEAKAVIAVPPPDLQKFARPPSTGNPYVEGLSYPDESG